MLQIKTQKGGLPILWTNFEIILRSSIDELHIPWVTDRSGTSTQAHAACVTTQAPLTHETNKLIFRSTKTLNSLYSLSVNPISSSRCLSGWISPASSPPSANSSTLSKMMSTWRSRCMRLPFLNTSTRVLNKPIIWCHCKGRKHGQRSCEYFNIFVIDPLRNLGNTASYRKKESNYDNTWAQSINVFSTNILIP